MAWIEPVTNRTSSAWHTLADQNRIAGNVDYLATELAAHQLYIGGTIQKTTYTYNDYIETDDWTDILGVLESMRSALALESAGALTEAMTYDNMNAVESLTLRIYDRLQLLLSQANNNHYPADTPSIYPSNEASSIYSAGVKV